MQFECNANDLWVYSRSPYFSFGPWSQSNEMKFAPFNNLSVKNLGCKQKF